MALAAQDIIDEVREFHMAFHPEVHTDQVILRALHRAEARFFDIISEVAPNALAVDYVFDAAAIAAGITGSPLALPAFRLLLPTAILVNDQGLFSVSIEEEEQSGGFNPATIRLVGRTLLIGQPTAFQDEMPDSVKSNLQDYSPFVDATGLRVTYVPTATKVTLGGDLTAPDDAERFIKGDILRFLATRDPTLTPQEKAALIATGDDLIDQVVRFYQTRSAAEPRWYVSRIG